MSITTILTGALELCAPVFLFLSAWRMTRENGPGLRGAAARIAAAFGLYWAIFLPRLVCLRATGQSDIGRMTILREALTLGHSVVPFAGMFGCYAAGVLLLLALSRVRGLGKWGTVFLYMVAPVTTAVVLGFYAPACVFALGNLLAAAPRALLRPLAAMGRQSLSMWLLSAAFFGASAPLCQRLLYAPVYPVLVLLWGLALCYAGACALSRFAPLSEKLPSGPLQIDENRV